ncbi:MAG: hypothetical protein IJ157_13705 [Clostridia bacterium]|nr:hypothetical protein [Clostridia bacterium]
MGLFHKTFPATDIDPQTRGFINATLEKILNDFDDPTLRSKAKSALAHLNSGKISQKDIRSMLDILEELPNKIEAADYSPKARQSLANIQARIAAAKPVLKRLL